MAQKEQNENHRYPDAMEHDTREEEMQNFTTLRLVKKQHSDFNLKLNWNSLASCKYRTVMCTGAKGTLETFMLKSFCGRIQVPFQWERLGLGNCFSVTCVSVGGVCDEDLNVYLDESHLGPII